MEYILLKNEEYSALIQRFDNIDAKINNISKGTENNRQWYTIQETCEILKISKRTLQSYRDDGILPFSQIGSKIYFKSSDIQEFLDRHYVKLKPVKR